MERKKRNSAVEALKLWGMFCIVFNHVAQTAQNHTLPLFEGLPRMQEMWLSFMRYGGAFGNTVFFVCSAWFLLDSGRCSVRKVCSMIVEVWLVSVLFLALFLAVMPDEISWNSVKASLMPLYFSNNWYITSYIFFYAFHPLLNSLIDAMNQRQLLRLALVVSSVGLVGSLLFCTTPLGGKLLTWVIIYFLMAYVKRYASSWVDTRRRNAWLLLGSVGVMVCYVATVIMARVSVTRGFSNENPLIIAIVLGLLGIALRGTWRSSWVNAASGLSLLVYIIHENLLVRKLWRPKATDFIVERWGYDHYAARLMLLAVGIFLASFLVAYVYKLVMARVVVWMSDRLYCVARRVVLWVEMRACVPSDNVVAKR